MPGCMSIVREERGDELGTHRVKSPPGALPQPAEVLDNDMSKLFATELLVDVSTLNLDAASFRQMEEAAGGAEGVPAMVLETIARRGKQHNPVTGSGGMLMGRVSRVGSLVRDRGLEVGDRIATLASLSLTPLRVDEIKAVRRESAQLDVVGQAVVFATAPCAKMPTDLPEKLALALFDVAGAAPQVARLARAGDTVIVLGAGGKSGLLCAAEARRRVGRAGRVLGVEAYPEAAEDLRGLGLCDVVLEADARDPVLLHQALSPLTGGRGADLTLSCVNVPGAELAAVLVTRSRGKVYYFAMSTSFTAAALGAEGVGRDVELYIGNGYCEGHAEHTLELVRGNVPLRRVLDRRYG
jgi:L-erythro-3,5-diaminohexanoate dehydrogenase